MLLWYQIRSRKGLPGAPAIVLVFFSMRQPRCKSLKQKTESKSIDSQISAPVSRLFLPLCALYFVQSPYCQLGVSDHVWQTYTSMQLSLQVTDRLRPTASGHLYKQNLNHGGKQVLATSQRSKQTQRLNPFVKSSVLKVQVASSDKQPFFFF